MMFINSFMGRAIAKMREKHVFDKMTDEKLLNTAHCPQNLPDEVKDKAIELIKSRLYNKSVIQELSLFKGIDKTIFDGMENIKAETICICRKQSYKVNLRYAKRIENCRVIKVDNSSHFIHHDCFDLVLSAIEGR